eukprot:scaffold334715_cov32-Prasinocladus_malaysianus.AAC.1
MPLLSGGPLSEALEDRGSLAEDDARGIISDVLRGVAYLHEHGYVHRDLKLSNVILEGDCITTRAKIVDFGMAKKFSAEIGKHTMCGCPVTVAPEVLHSQGENEYGKKVASYDTKADVWSCGVMLYMLLSGEPPFDSDQGIYALFRQIKKGSYNFNDNPAWHLVSDEAKGLIEKMMEIDPAERITAAEALKHPWMCLA